MKKTKRLIILTFLCITVLFYIFAYTNIDSTIPVIKTIESNVINYEEIKEENKSDIESIIKEDEFNKENTNEEYKSQNYQSTAIIENSNETLDNDNKPENQTAIVTEQKDINIEHIKNDQSSLGTNGRLYLPSVNHNVALFTTNLYEENNNAQEIVNNKDSAAYFTLGDHYIIADHNYQGFKKIIDLNIGDKSYIKNNDGTITTYTLINKFIGENIKTDLISKDGISVQDMETDLVMYTCYNKGNDIMITLWKLEQN